MAKSIRQFRFLTALGVLCATACRHDPPPPADTSAVPDPGAPPASGKAEYHEDTFDLAIRPIGALTSGTPGAVEIQLSAKGGYHCNDKYPYKFKTGQSEGIQFAAPVFTKDALTLEEMKATMKVDLTPQTKGEKSIRGMFAFSLCSAERCLVEKRELETKIAVN